MAQRNINWKGIAVAMGLPLSFFIIIMVLKARKMGVVPKPGYYVMTNGAKAYVPHDSLNGRAPVVAPEFYGINQMGEHIALNRDLAGKVLVLDFIFTQCPAVCPKLTHNMALLQSLYHATATRRNDTIAQFITITVNPEHDSAEVLRAYSQKFQANSDHWWFLTGDKKAIYNYIGNSLGLVQGTNDGGADDFIHTQKIVVLDKNRRIRGYYDGLDTLDLRRCADDIGWLYVEKN